MLQILTQIKLPVLLHLAFPDDADGAFVIDSLTGEVNLTINPDADVTETLSFAVQAINSENNSVQQVVSLDINNLDDTAPIIVSDETAQIDENSGAGQIVYIANADDSSDVSAGVTYSILDNDIAQSEVNLPVLAPNTQHVYVSESIKSQDASQETIVISYQADERP